MQIRAIGCIERTEDGSIIDPTTGYIYDPLTGLPIDLGTVGGGEGGGNQLELDCFNKFLNFIEYYKDKENKPAEYFVLIQYLVCLMDNCNSCLNLPFTKLEDNKKCSVTFCNLDIPDVIEEEEEEEELPEFPDIDLGIGVDDTWINVEPIHTDMEDTTIVEQSPVWWYHSDHLGSSSYITDLLGKPVQYYEYLPFGEIMVQQSTNNIFENVYKFNGKELDEQTGYYYYGARYYDPATSIFLSVDPHAEKYPNYNPYTYVLNNPINAIDPDGRDVVILSYGAKSRGHKYGHNAVLVGSDKKGWTYFSLDGDGPSEYGKGRINDGFTISKKGEYKSLKDFAQSEFNTFKEDYDDGKGFKNSERDSNGDLIQRYAKAFQISTTEEQDANMFKTATESTSKDYDLFCNRCTDNVNETLTSGDQKSGDAFWPSTNFDNIEKDNKGKRVDSQLKINNPKQK